MLFSKANLAVRNVSSKDGKNQVFNSVHFAEDGSTVATNGRMLMAVSPVDVQRVHYPESIEHSGVEPGVDGVSVALDIIQQVVKNLPRDKRMSLQHVAMTDCEERRVEFTTTDMTKEQRVAAAPLRDKYPEWKKVLKEARDKVGEKNGGGRVCVNRKDLLQLLDALEAACPDKGNEDPVFIEWSGDEGDGIVLRAENHETGQHAVGFVMPLHTGGEWLRDDTWERRIFGKTAKLRKRRR